MRRPRDLPPSLDDLAQIGRDQIATIPEPFRKHFRDVVIRVDEFCDESVEREMDLESPFDLLGLYRGVSLDRRPILDFWCETGEDLGRIVRHVLIHEVGHHFGLSDDDMDRIEDEG